MWDELLLGLGLHYDAKNDKIVGFEDWGNVRAENYSDHSLVFMMRLVKAGDKMPIGFNFCEKTTKAPQLLFCMKEVIKLVRDAGFDIVATVCDGSSCNRSAVKTLIYDTKRIKGEEYVLKSKYIEQNLQIFLQTLTMYELLYIFFFHFLLF